MNPWLSSEEAAQLIGVSTSRVDRLVADGILVPHVTHLGRRKVRRFAREAVETYAQDRAQARARRGASRSRDQQQLNGQIHILEQQLASARQREQQLAAELAVATARLETSEAEIEHLLDETEALRISLNTVTARLGRRHTRPLG